MIPSTVSTCPCKVKVNGHEHVSDSDCHGFIHESGLCNVCGVDHNDQCAFCQGRGFHNCPCPDCDCEFCLDKYKSLGV